MTLRLEAAVREALDRGWIEASDIVRGDLVVSAAAGRNLNLWLTRRRAPGYLVKRPDPEARDTGWSLRNEARFYRFCSREPRAAALARFMPRVADAVESESIALLERVEEARSLWQLYRDHPPGDLPRSAPRDLGRALGTLHATFRDPELRARLDLDESLSGPPAYFDLHRPHPAMLRDASAARLELARLLQGEASIGAGLDAGRAAWRLETVIHGDVRSENLLLTARTGGVEPRLRLADWEFVQLGDPAWDLAGALEDHARFWVESMSHRPDLDPAGRVATASYPLEALYPALDALWEGYRAAAGLSPAEAPELLRRAVLHSGTRLVQTAWEHCRYLERISSLAVMLTQLSANLLADPERARVELYGLDFVADG